MNTQTSQTENSLPYCEKLPETACATSLSNVTVSRVSLRAAKCHSLLHLHTVMLYLLCRREDMSTQSPIFR